MILNKVRAGKSIGAQALFTKTINNLIDFVANLKGDYDDNPSTGHISLDRSVEDFPVLRFRGETGGDSKITIVGTDGVTQKSGKKIIFVSGDDSNISIVPSLDSAGNIILTCNIYYKEPPAQQAQAAQGQGGDA